MLMELTVIDKEHPEDEARWQQAFFCPWDVARITPRNTRDDEYCSVLLKSGGWVMLHADWEDLARSVSDARQLTVLPFNP